MRRRAFLQGAMVAAAGTSLALGAGCATTPVAGPAESGHPLAGLVDMGGRPLKPPMLDDAVVLVDFWASWCQPCRQAFRYMDQLYRTYQGDGLRMLAVSIDDDLVAARRFWAAARPRFPVGWDAAGQVRERFAVLTLPTTVLLDTDGEVVERMEGFDPAAHRILEEQVHRLLRG